MSSLSREAGLLPLLLFLVFHLCRGGSAPVPRPTAAPSAVKTARPTALPTFTEASGAWVYQKVYESSDCSGTPFNVSGNALGQCLPLFSRGRAQGSYLYSSCVTDSSVQYQEFSSSDCSGTATVQRTTKGACVPLQDPNSPDVWHVSTVNCFVGVGLPPLPSGMVVQNLFSDCSSSTQPVAFSAQNVLKCNMNPGGNAFTQLYALSNSWACDAATGIPQQVGYLGTHCSKKSLVSNLAQTCAPLMGWQASRYATASSYMCTPPDLPQPPTGWLTQTYFDQSSCAGTVLSVTGQATGVCTVGYNNGSVIVQSSMVQCDGTYLYKSVDCSGPYTKVNALPQKSCQNNVGGFGLSFGGSGASFLVGCSKEYATIPRPFQGHSIVLWQYGNDLCKGNAVSFRKMPQDQPYVGGNGRYSQLVSCATGSPTLTISLGSSATSTFSLFLDGGCSYLDQAYTSSSFLTSKTAANPLGLAYTSSQLYSSCEGTALPVPSAAPTPSAIDATIQSGRDPSPPPPLSGAQVAAVVLGITAVVAVLVFLYYRQRGPSTYSPAAASAGVELPAVVRNPLNDDSDVEQGAKPKKANQANKPKASSMGQNVAVVNPLLASAAAAAASAIEEQHPEKKKQKKKKSKLKISEG